VGGCVGGGAGRGGRGGGVSNEKNPDPIKRTLLSLFQKSGDFTGFSALQGGSCLQFNLSLLK